MADLMESLASRVRSITGMSIGVSASNSFRDTQAYDRNDELAATADRTVEALLADEARKASGLNEPDGFAEQPRPEDSAGGGIPAPRESGPVAIGNVERPTRMVSLRLCESDYQLLQQTCRESNLDRSTLLRQLIRLRVVMADEGFWGYAEGFTDSQDRVIVVDRTAIMQASREMVRWGNHYNQAVHALNTIALQLTRGRNLNEQWLTEQIQEIRLQLEAVQEGREGIAAALNRIATFPTMKGR